MNGSKLHLCSCPEITVYLIVLDHFDSFSQGHPAIVSLEGQCQYTFNKSCHNKGNKQVHTIIITHLHNQILH